MSSCQEYRAQRLRRGNLSQVAASLGVSPSTIMRRENGTHEVSKEAMSALLSVPMRNEKHCNSQNKAVKKSALKQRKDAAKKPRKKK
jgi:transcriptional regulator with XRE-family HTH domain